MRTLLIRALLPARIAIPSHLIAMLLLATDMAATDPPGVIIEGRVLDRDTGDPLPDAHVILAESPARGGITDGEGRFRLTGMPPGSYTLRISYMGYRPASEVIVVGDAPPEGLEVRLEATFIELTDPVVVEGRRVDEGDVRSSQSTASIDPTIFDDRPVDSFVEVLDLEPGVVVQAGQMTVRGGRPGEITQVIDGVAVDDPLGGGLVELNPFAVESAEVIVGGLDAKHGNTQSGVFSVTTREGGDRVAGSIRYETDDFGAPDRSFENLDRVQLGVGGPLPVRNATFFFAYQGTWADSDPATSERRDHRRVLDFISVGDRKVNDVRVQSKVAWRPDPASKIAMELIDNRSRADDYHHLWSWEGYVRTFLDTVEVNGRRRTVRRPGPWSTHRVDDSYTYYNAAEHTPERETRFRQVKLAITRTVGDGDTVTSLKLSRNRFATDRKVRGQEPWEYAGDARRDLFFDHENAVQSLFYARNGDYPLWEERETKVSAARWELTRRQGTHLIELGGDLRYNDVRYHQVLEPYLFRDSERAIENGVIGNVDRYHVYQWEGSAYLQDRWEHEGMVVNAGVRYDLYDVGDQLDLSTVERARTGRLSPRIGIAYPITERDAFSFHYGRYHQIPDRRYLYENLAGLGSGPRGNPNLTTETTVSYQAAVQHLFGTHVRGQVAVYYKDILGLLAVVEEQVDDRAQPQTVYDNRDHASSRGLEVSLTRSFAGGFTGSLSYGYGIATGTQSDPNTGTVLNFRYVPISEQPLDWDRRHKVSASFTVADPAGHWSLGGIWRWGTGFPYTPATQDSRDVEPETVNSRRLPGDTSLDVQVERRYEAWGQPFKVFVQARNLLDTRNVATLAPANWPLPSQEIANDYAVYYTETGNLGGAVLADDRDGDGAPDWLPLNDPRVFGERRTIRMGVQLDF